MPVHTVTFTIYDLGMTKRRCFRILPSKSVCLTEEANRVSDTNVSFEYDLACLDFSDVEM